MSLGLRAERYRSEDAQRAFWQRLMDGANRLPGVQATALGSGVPLTNDHSRRDISIEGQSYPVGAMPHPDVHLVTPGYPAVLGIRLLQGRVFTDADRPQTLRVGLINRTIADRYFAGADPIGRRFAFGRAKPGDSPSWITIVGVLEDTRMYGLDNPSRLEVYLPLAQSMRDGMTLLVKSAGDPSALVPSVRSVVSSIDSDQPIADVAAMSDRLEESVSTRHQTFVLLAIFSTLALTLAAIGIYGVMSYRVAQRTNELGIRLALGARPADLVGTVLGQGLTIAGAGMALGVGLALVLTRVLRTLLFGVSAMDPATFAAVGAGVAVVAMLACAIPGWRALRVDPQIALRRQ
jgi:putative ABC transport system permease protein